MAKGSRRKDDRQLDLFDAPVVMPAPSDNVQAPVKVPPIDPVTFGDARLVEALAAASLQDVQAIVAQVVVRRPRGWEGAALRANKRETTDWLKFTLEGAGERTHGYAFTDTTFAGCWI